jgi:hypothetical protein
MAEIVDLRGRRRVPVPAPVLADPSGRRARALARLGRGISFVMLMWVIGLVLAGIGVLPAGDLPLGPVVAGDGGPVALRTLPRDAPPSRSDLLPASPTAQAPVRKVVAAPRDSTPPALQGRAGSAVVAGFSHPAANKGGMGPGRVQPAPRSSAASGRGHGAGGVSGATGSSSGAGTLPAASGAPAAPTSNGRRSIAHGHRPATHSGSTPSASSGSAPGRVKHSAATPTTTTTSTSPGNSGSSPGHTSPRAMRYGNGG